VKAKTAGAKKKAAKKSEASVSYDEFKQYDGQQYTGMKVGRSHKWYYDKGVTAAPPEPAYMKRTRLYKKCTYLVRTFRANSSRIRYLRVS
jgi:hypothetical protein